jgi:hypothetical protein
MEGLERLLRDKIRPSRVPPLSEEAAERLVAMTLGDPLGEKTHWTGAHMAKGRGLSASSIPRDRKRPSLYCATTPEAQQTGTGPPYHRSPPPDCITLDRILSPTFVCHRTFFTLPMQVKAVGEFLVPSVRPACPPTPAAPPAQKLHLLDDPLFSRVRLLEIPLRVLYRPDCRRNAIPKIRMCVKKRK